MIDATKNKLDYYRGKDYMKRFCIDLRKHATKIINYEKTEMIPLTNEEQNYIVRKKYVIYVKTDLVLMMTIKIIIKSEIIVITLEDIEEVLMIFSI